MSEKIINPAPAHRGGVKLIASCFYLGYVPIIPGTMGSLLGLGIYLLTGQNLPIYSVITIFLLTIGFLVCGKAEVAFGQKDSKRIVIDEAVGMTLTYFAIPLKFWIVSLGFFVFRILDLLKIFPAGSLQRRWRGSGVMWDDIFAGIYSNLLLRMLLIL
jgi:phosphatidylglycerophosphatase A